MKGRTQVGWRRLFPFGSSSIRDGKEGVGAVPPTTIGVLCDLAADIFNEVVLIRELNVAPDLGQVRGRLVTQMRSFQCATLGAGVDKQTGAKALYALCTLLDEVVSGRDWGRGEWAKYSLLMIFHNERAGGEGFFEYLSAAELEPAENLALLELMYLCLALGLEGRYRIQIEGGAALALRRSQLYETIRLQQGGGLKAGVSSLNRGDSSHHKNLLCWATGFLLLGVIVGVSYYLEGRSFQELQRLQALQPLLPERTKTFSQTLVERLADDIKSGRLTLTDEGSHTRMILSAKELFASGSTKVMQFNRPQLQRIAAALSDFSGRVHIIGHSDDMPMAKRSVSNQALSLARAQSVMAVLLGNHHNPQRFYAEGRGEAEPLFPNTSLENRARNRRVEIMVFTPELPVSPK